jgi:hypothetical protein
VEPPVSLSPSACVQEVVGMKGKEPPMNLAEVEEVDIENMTMEELREFIAAAEAEVTNVSFCCFFLLLLLL